jgi:hypothetical protein
MNRKSISNDKGIHPLAATNDKGLKPLVTTTNDKGACPLATSAETTNIFNLFII